MTTFIGFRGFAKPQKIEEAAVEEKIKNSNIENLYVLWTGGTYRARKASGRSQSLATITEKNVPVPLSEVYRRAAKAVGGDKGFNPELVRSGLFLHAGAKPCVYYALEKKSDGSFTLVKTVPHPEGDKAPILAGSVIVPAPDAEEKPALPAPKAPKAPKAKGGRK